jgi:hypothetical protein
VIGKRDNTATALAGGLILKEAAKVPAEGYIGGEFRHGPLEIAGPGLTAVLLGLDQSEPDPSLPRRHRLDQVAITAARRFQRPQNIAEMSRSTWRLLGMTQALLKLDTTLPVRFKAHPDRTGLPCAASVTAWGERRAGGRERMPSDADSAGPIGVPPLVPGAVPLLGHVIPLLRDPLEFMDRLRDHGPVVRIMLGRVAVYVVTDAALTHEMLTARSRSFGKGGRLIEALGRFAGNGLATVADGELHRRQRLLTRDRRRHAGTHAVGVPRGAAGQRAPRGDAAEDPVRAARRHGGHDPGDRAAPVACRDPHPGPAALPGEPHAAARRDQRPGGRASAPARRRGADARGTSADRPA